MARINVEQKALTDPRFDLLGRFLQSNRHDALGRMLMVWNECQERSTYTLPERLVGAVMGSRDGAEWVVEADLAEWIDDKNVRIKGTQGRIEWLEIKRAAARNNGKQGGRPPTEPKPNQTETDVGIGSDTVGFPAETPPAPALKTESITGKPKIQKRFVAPSVDEVRAYCLERRNAIDPERFVDHYTANGWVQSSGRPIRDWQAAVRTWEKNEKNNGAAPKRKMTPEERDESDRHAAFVNGALLDDQRVCCNPTCKRPGCLEAQAAGHHCLKPSCPHPKCVAAKAAAAARKAAGP